MTDIYSIDKEEVIMFDIEILGYNFYRNYDINKYPVVEMKARYEDDAFINRITFERIYDAIALVYNDDLNTIADMIKNFVDELWKEFHKGIPKVYEISFHITLPVIDDGRIKYIINREFKKRLDMKRDEDKLCRALSNSRFGLGIEPNHYYAVLPRGSGKWETQMKMFENYIKTGKVEFVPNRDIRTLLPESCYIDTDTVLADSIVDTLRYAQYDIKYVDKYLEAKEKIKEYEKMKIENVIFNDPATIVFWRDGSKTVVKAKDEPYDPEKGLAMAIAKKAYGNEGNYYNEFKKFIKDDVKEESEEKNE